MAKTLEQAIQERVQMQIGALVVQTIADAAKIEALEAENAALKAEALQIAGKG